MNHSQRGAIPILLLVAFIGILAFLIVSNIAPFKDSFLNLIYPKDSSEAASKPNIIFILADDQSYDSLQYMPYLSSKPKGSWIEFTNAFDSTPLCCPSRANILTGQYTHNTGVFDNHLGHKLNAKSTIATALDKAGYKTALIGKYLNDYHAGDQRHALFPPGWDYWSAYKGLKYFDFDLIEKDGEKHYSGENNYAIDILAQKAVDFINSSINQQPLFLYFAPLAPHTGTNAQHEIAPRHRAAAVPPLPKYPNFNEEDMSDKPYIWNNTAKKDVAEIQRYWTGSYRTLLSADDAIKKIIDALDNKGILENTVIVFMSDNGFSYGAHRWLGKDCAYEECAKTPFMVRFPGVSNRIETKLVNSVDIAPTFAELGGATITHKVDGISLIPLLKNPSTPWRSGILLERLASRNGGIPDYYALRTDGFKYIKHLTRDGSRTQIGEELYNLKTDPYELQNKALDPTLIDTKNQLKALAEKLADQLPEGNVNPEHSSCTVVVGWACDLNTPTQATNVQIYLDGKFVTKGVANKTGEEAIASRCGGYKDKRYVISVPNPPKDGKNHTLDVYAVNNIPNPARVKLNTTPLNVICK